MKTHLMHSRRWLALCALLVPLAAMALQAPKCSQQDSRICTYEFQENQVYQIVGFLGYPTMIIFGEKEVVEMARLYTGFAPAWEFTTGTDSGLTNRLGIKLRGIPNHDAKTSLIVTTNKHVYVFELITKTPDGVARSANEKNMAWLIRFDYPSFAKNDDVATTPPVLNYRYRACGNAKEFPYHVWDDGKFTYFEFYKEQLIPAFFVIGSDKQPRSANLHLKGDIRVVQQLAEEFRLRAGDSVVCVKRIDPITRTHAP